MPNFIVSRPFIYVAGTIIDPNQNNPNETTIYGGHNGSMDGVTGHNHDGTTGSGPKIAATGIDLTATYNWSGLHTHANNLDIYNGFDLRLFSDAGVTKKYSIDSATGNVAMIPTANLFFDNGVGNVFIQSPNGTTNLDFYTGGALALDITTVNAFFINKNVNIDSGFKYFLDGGGDTFFQELNPNNIDFFIGGSHAYNFDANGVLLPDTDPPLANYANRNGITKAWLNMPAAGTTPNGSYNISSIAHTNGSGIYNVTFNTDFADTNYSVVVTAKSGNSSIATANITGVSTVQIRTWDGVTNTATDIDFQMIAIGDQ